MPFNKKEKIMEINKIADDNNFGCSKCGGKGLRMYPNTATYRDAPGIVSGQAFTEDVCDKCWGSGNENNPGENLRDKDSLK